MLPAFFSVFDIRQIITLHIFPHFARSQPFLKWCYTPFEFSLLYRFSGKIRSLSLAVLYAPILPVSPILGFVALFLNYLTDRWLSLFVCRQPQSVNIEALDYVLLIMALLPCGQLLLIYMVYYRGEDLAKVTVAPFAVGMFIYLLWVFLPFKQRLGYARYEILDDGGTGDLRCVLGYLSGHNKSLECQLCVA
jgi:lipid-A-disaccharide synthase-like uncharacterized protein